MPFDKQSDKKLSIHWIFIFLMSDDGYKEWRMQRLLSFEGDTWNGGKKDRIRYFWRGYLSKNLVVLRRFLLIRQSQMTPFTQRYYSSTLHLCENFAVWWQSMSTYKIGIIIDREHPKHCRKIPYLKTLNLWQKGIFCSTDDVYDTQNKLKILLCCKL